MDKSDDQEFQTRFFLENFNGKSREELKLGANELVLVEQVMGNGLLGIARNQGVKLARAVCYVGPLWQEKKRWSPDRAGRVLQDYLSKGGPEGTGGSITDVLQPTFNIINMWLREFTDWDRAEDDDEEQGPKHQKTVVNKRKGEFAILLAEHPWKFKLGANEIANIEDSCNISIREAGHNPGITMTRAIIYSGLKWQNIPKWTPLAAGRMLDEHMEKGGTLRAILEPTGEIFRYWVDDFSEGYGDEPSKGEDTGDNVSPSSATVG